MNKFEVGKMYGEHAVKYEIVARTAKTITYREVSHIGRINEKKSEAKRVKISDWENREVFYTHYETVEA